MDPPSETGFITDVCSSPIPEHQQNELSSFDIGINKRVFDDLPKPKKHGKGTGKKGKKGEIEDTDEIALWSPAKRQSWEARKTNPNAFFYRHVEPGQVKRTGPWDESEKELFMKAIQLHPPTQGKWGLFAMNIPGRVGYQCRNFYHRLLESGELHEETIPGEVKAPKSPKTPKATKKRATKAKRVSKKKKQFVESDESDSDDNEVVEEAPELYEDFPVEEKVVEEPVVEQEEEVAVEQEAVEEKVAEAEFQINSLRLFSTRVNEEDERLLKQPEAPVEYIDEISTVEEPSAPASEVVEAAAETVQKIVEPLKWAPRMANPWETVETKQAIIFPHDEQLDNKPEFEYQCSKIMKYNCNEPLNLILFSFPVPKGMRHKYLHALRHRLANNTEGGQLKGAVHQYFKVKQECLLHPENKDELCSKFVQGFVNEEF